MEYESIQKSTAHKNIQTVISVQINGFYIVKLFIFLKYCIYYEIH